MEPLGIAKKLKDEGYEVYYVGGYVRDFLLKKNPSDVDLTTNATPDQIASLFSDRKIDYVGTEFKVTLIDGIDVATYRKDVYSYNAITGKIEALDHVEFAETLEEDLGRRDLTINAIAMDPFTGDIIDPFDGKKDLKDKIIRFVGDGKQRLHEDPCRALRACRFVAIIDGRFSMSTYSALYSFLNGMSFSKFNKIKRERFQLEIIKAMKAEKASKFFNALKNLNIVDTVFDIDLFRMINLDGGKYHDETVWEHSMMCGDKVRSSDPIIKLGAYFHDIGKPLAYDLNCDGSFKDHHKVGVKLAKTIFSRLRFSTEDINFICDCIYFHMYNLNTYDTPRNYRRIMNRIETKKRSKTYSWVDLLVLRLADDSSNLKKDPDEVQKHCDIFYNGFLEVMNSERAFSIKDLAISGNDVMVMLGISPGPEVGKVLNDLLRLVIDDPELNDRGTLMKYLMENLLNTDVHIIKEEK